MPTFDDDSAAELAEEVRLAVSYFVRQTRARSDELTRSRADALGTLEREGAQTIKGLASRLAVHHQAMSRTVRELHDLGYVEREVSSTDGRASVIRLTDEGLAALLRDRNARRDLIREGITERLDDRDREILRAVPDLFTRLVQ